MTPTSSPPTSFILQVLLLATSLRRCAVDKNIAIRIEQVLARIVVLKLVADSIGENHLLCFEGIAMR